MSAVSELQLEKKSLRGFVFMMRIKRINPSLISRLGLAAEAGTLNGGEGKER